MEKTGCKVTVKVEEPKQQGDYGIAVQAGSSSATVLPLQQGMLLPADRFAVVLPEILRGAPATITVSFGDQRGEAKDAEDKREKAGRVIKMGPCGGPGGDVWKMDVHGRIEQTEHWGNLEGRQRSEICLEPDEYLTGMQGHVCKFGGCFLIGALTLVGNRRTFGPYGTRKGPPFELPAAGGRIVGFHGRSGGHLNALGTYVEMDD